MSIESSQLTQSYPKPPSKITDPFQKSTTNVSTSLAPTGPIFQRRRSSQVVKKTLILLGQTPPQKDAALSHWDISRKAVLRKSLQNRKLTDHPGQYEEGEERRRQEEAPIVTNKSYQNSKLHLKYLENEFKDSQRSLKKNLIRVKTRGQSRSPRTPLSHRISNPNNSSKQRLKHKPFIVITKDSMLSSNPTSMENTPTTIHTARNDPNFGPKVSHFFFKGKSKKKNSPVFQKFFLGGDQKFMRKRARCKSAVRIKLDSVMYS